MRGRWRISLLILLVLLGGLLLVSWMRNSGVRAARRAAESARARAKAQGFRMTVKDFVLSLTSEEAARERVLTNLGPRLNGDPVPWPSQPNYPGTSGVAVCRWQNAGPWAEAISNVATLNKELDAACVVLNNQERIRFIPNLEADLFPEYYVKSILRWLGCRVQLALRDGDMQSAWINLLAVTVLATQYQPSGIDFGVLGHGEAMRLAFYTTWEAMQTNAWSEAQLTQLAGLWESAEFFHTLPEVGALDRVRYLRMAEISRGPVRTDPNDTDETGARLGDFISEPRAVWTTFRRRFQERSEAEWYRREGSYLDEAAIINESCDYERMMRVVASTPSWRLIQSLISKPQSPPVHLPPLPPLDTLAYLSDQLRYSEHNYIVVTSMAEAEARRRVVLGALDIYRHRLRTGSSRSSPLDASALPKDFITGERLHLKNSDDGMFLLYSVGLDGRDDGGDTSSMPLASGSMMWTDRDFVWPRPATGQEILAWKASLPRPAIGAETDRRLRKMSEAMMRRYHLVRPASTNSETVSPSQTEAAR